MFRAEVRTFIRERFPSDYLPDLDSEPGLEPEDVDVYNWAADRKSADPVRRAAARAWAAALAAEGWITPGWPREYGGAALGVVEEFILKEELMRARVPVVNSVGAALVGPTLLKFGTEAQRRRHLPAISSGRIAWAQGFSEPDAGSDLAGLQTRAVRDGDSYRVNGLKAWVSIGQYADWLFMLARTNRNAPKHRGITFLLVDLRTPGITIQPTTDLRGGTPFAEIIFEDVRVPVTERVGEENQGFFVAMATLEFERAGIGATVRFEQALARLIDFIRSPAGRPYLRSDWAEVCGDEIVQRHIETRVLYNLVLHMMSKQAAGLELGYEASVVQLFRAELHQRLAKTGAQVFGNYAHLWQRTDSPLEAEFTHELAGSLAATFMAGSSEIQRNVIATRGLGLPRQ